tara:strand:+ start:670 stop:1158 length:489 start_codon:yes stop_codon:yes gene_type:complete
MKFFFKNIAHITLLSGLLSYCYLFLNLLNNKFDIIFLYFITLSCLYFFMKEKSYVVNFILLIIHYLLTFNKSIIESAGNIKTFNNIEDAKAQGKNDMEDQLNTIDTRDDKNHCNKALTSGVVKNQTEGMASSQEESKKLLNKGYGALNEVNSVQEPTIGTIG